MSRSPAGDDEGRLFCLRAKTRTDLGRRKSGILTAACPMQPATERVDCLPSGSLTLSTRNAVWIKNFPSRVKFATIDAIIMLMNKLFEILQDKIGGVYNWL